MRDHSNQVSAWNIANALTALRLVLVPVFGYFLLVDSGDDTGWRVAAATAFCVAALTDRLDGELARRHGLITDVGKIADPIADKALIGTALVGLSILGELPWWVTVVVLVREIGITVMRLVVIRHRVMPAGRGGKAKTALQTLAVVLYLLGRTGTAHTVAVAVMALAVVVTVATGVDYVAQALRLVYGRQSRTSRTASQPGTDLTALLDELRTAGQTVAVAESLTGGQVLARLIAVPGASSVVRGGVVAYATDLKHRLLGVDPELLAAHGAVHPEVATAMARGVREILGATWGLATTGVAGPDPADGKAVGTVYVAVCGPDTLHVRSPQLSGGREAIRAATTAAVLDLLKECLEHRPVGSQVPGPTG